MLVLVLALAHNLGQLPSVLSFETALFLIEVGGPLTVQMFHFVGTEVMVWSERVAVEGLPSKTMHV